MDKQEQKQLTPIHEYSLIDSKNEKGIRILAKDGIPCKCHKVPAIPLPEQLSGQIALHYENCKTSCTRCLILTDGDNTYVYQNCEGIAQKFLIKNVNISLG